LLCGLVCRYNSQRQIDCEKPLRKNRSILFVAKLQKKLRAPNLLALFFRQNSLLRRKSFRALHSSIANFLDIVFLALKKLLPSQANFNGFSVHRLYNVFFSLFLTFPLFFSFFGDFYVTIVQNFFSRSKR
jgi:hypothetical protein